MRSVRGPSWAASTTPTTALREADGVLAPYTRIAPFADMLSYAQPTPKLVRWQDIADSLKVERDAAGAQKKTAREALEDAAQEARPLIQEG